MSKQLGRRNDNQWFCRKTNISLTSLLACFGALQRCYLNAITLYSVYKTSMTSCIKTILSMIKIYVITKKNK